MQPRLAGHQEGAEPVTQLDGSSSLGLVLVNKGASMLLAPGEEGPATPGPESRSSVCPGGMAARR
jgi:hypothetical protein